MIRQQTKAEFIIKKVHPFVCYFMPFVCLKSSFNLPFVGCKSPLVRYNGFTLIELIITLTVAGILMSIAIPSMRTFSQNARITTQANDLSGDLSFARSEAIKVRKQVIVCKSANPTATSPTCDTGSTTPWTTGRLIFVDMDKDSTLSSGDEILRIRESLDGNGNRLTATVTSIIFLATGLTSAAGTFTLCDSRTGWYGRTITVGSTGRPTMAPANC